MNTKKKPAAKAPEPTLRHLWLAGLGLVAVARREALQTAGDVAARLDALKRQAERFASDAQSNVLEGIAHAREQGEVRVGQFSSEVEARLAPVLVKLGLKPKPQRSAKPRSRKPAKKAAKKAAAPRGRTAARKPAAKRTVRKRSA